MVIFDDLSGQDLSAYQYRADQVLFTIKIWLTIDLSVSSK